MITRKWGLKMEKDNQTADDLKRQRNNEAAARYRERNRDIVNQRMRDWRENNREKFREQSRGWRNRKLANGSPEEVALIRQAERDKTNRINARNRAEVFAAYGGYKCNCCGETESLFLTIDHVHNNGAELRRSGVHGNGSAFYAWLRKNGFPDGFQVLCMNCQLGKHRNGGVCPHQSS